MSQVTRVIVSPDGSATDVTEGTNLGRGVDNSITHGTPGGESHTSGITRVSSADLLPPPDGTILGTARGPGGRFVTGRDLERHDVTVELEPGNPGTRTSIGVALDMGYLQRSGDGNYHERGAQIAKHDQQRAAAQQQAAANSQELFPPAAEAQLAKDIAPLSQEAYHAALHEVITDGTVSPQLVELMGHELRTSQADVLAMIDRTMAQFSAQGAQAAASVGVPPRMYPAFVAWSNADARKDMRDSAMIEHVYTRSTKGIREMAKSFLRSYEPSAEELHAAGYKVRTVNGHNVVEVDGHEVSVASAVRAGWLRYE